MLSVTSWFGYCKISLFMYVIWHSTAMIQAYPSGYYTMYNKPTLSSLSTLCMYSNTMISISNRNRCVYTSNTVLFASSKPKGASTLKRGTKSNIIASKEVVKAPPDDGLSRTVFIGNLPFMETDGDIRDCIDQNLGQGLIREVQFIKGKKTGRQLGYGFVHFHDPDMAIAGAELFNGLEFLGRTLNSNVKGLDDVPVSVQKKASQFKPTHSIFLANLDYSLTEIEIENMCDDMLGPGLVDSIKIVRDKITNVPRGIAQIQFKHSETVNAAIDALTGLEVFGKQLDAKPLIPQHKIGKKVEKKPEFDVPEEVEDEDSMNFDSFNRF